jgi:hypothetical protein
MVELDYLLFGLNQGAAMTDAQWLAQNLKCLGYDFFHIDEGYQYSRGDYATVEATLFPEGIGELEKSQCTRTNAGLVDRSV